MDYYRHLVSYQTSSTFSDWRNSFSQLYGVEDLSQLHNYLPPFTDYCSSNDSSTLLHKIFYSNFNSIFSDLYSRLLLEVKTILNEPFYFQNIPCVRFGFPDTTWLTDFHKDSFYNHPSKEININFASTRSFGSAALQIESSPGSGVFVPLVQDAGCFTFINHINCLHGSIINQEKYTMISLDFRVVPVSESTEAFSEKQSILTSAKFKPGSYFSTSPL